LARLSGLEPRAVGLRPTLKIDSKIGPEPKIGVRVGPRVDPKMGRDQCPS